MTCYILCTAYIGRIFYLKRIKLWLYMHINLQMFRFAIERKKLVNNVNNVLAEKKIQ